MTAAESASENLWYYDPVPFMLTLSMMLSSIKFSHLLLISEAINLRCISLFDNTILAESRFEKVVQENSNWYSKYKLK